MTRVRGLLVSALAACAILSGAHAEDPLVPAPWSAEFPASRVAADRAGNAFVAGMSGNVLRVARFDAAGERRFDVSWTLSDFTSLEAIAAAGDGGVWLGGQTYAANFPVTAALQPAYLGTNGDGWYARLAADGSIATASYLGGTDEDSVRAIAVDSTGAAVLAGTTISADFPVVAPFDPGFDSAAGPPFLGFVCRVTADGSTMLHGSRFGGRMTWASCVAVEADDTAVVVGYTNSSRLPVRGAFQPLPDPFTTYGVTDAFVTRVAADGSLRSSTFFGGRGFDRAHTVHVAPDGGIVLSGFTDAVPMEYDAVSTSTGTRSFVARLLPAATGVSWTRFHTGRTAGIDPDGRISTAEGGAFRVLSASGDVERTLRFPPRSVRDVATAGDGSVVYAASEDPIPFGVASELPTPRQVPWAARVPVGGIEPPSRVDLTGAGSNAIEVTWPDDGDPASRYVVERVTDDRLEPLAVLPPGALAVRDEGLAQDTAYAYRVVAQFPSGAASEVWSERSVRTLPAAPTDVVADWARPGVVALSWSHPTRALPWFEIEQQVGDGAPVIVQIPTSVSLGTRSLEIATLAPPGQVVRHRLRASNESGFSEWTYAEPLASDADVSVLVTGGRARRRWSGTFWRIHGRVEPADGTAPFAFDPVTQPLAVLFQRDGVPLEQVIPAGDPGWTIGRRTAVWRSEALFDFGVGRLSLDRHTGRFRVDAYFWHEDLPAAPSIAVGLGFAFGERSGGTTATWRRRRGGFVAPSAR